KSPCSEPRLRRSSQW
ncbi:bacterial virulence factor lipase N-terminal family protein, partial [Vibrio parahaemolyticus V-223/04]